MKTKLTIIIFITFFSSGFSQNEIDKVVIESVFEETLRKSRNAVETATNEWRYDNSNEDYFVGDTLTFNSARSYRKSYCKEINWSFYEVNKCLINTIPKCTEPPTSLISKEEDYMTIEVIQENNSTLIHLKNLKGIINRFEVLELIKNQPVYNEASAFDYTLKLLRLE
jgi:hypothetical protein